VHLLQPLLHGLLVAGGDEDDRGDAGLLDRGHDRLGVLHGERDGLLQQQVAAGGGGLDRERAWTWGGTANVTASTASNISAASA
jgi:hypothetical protein